MGGKLFFYVDNTIVVTRAPLLIAYLINRLNLRGMCPATDDAMVPGNFAISAIENGNNGYFFLT